MEPRPLIAEALGTFALTLVGAGAVVLASNDLASGLIGVALAHGLIIMGMIAIFGALSGGHFNPAVTIGAWLMNRVDSAKAGAYIGAQLAGAVLGALVLKAVIPAAVGEAAAYGVPSVGRMFGTGSAQAVLAEAVFAFLFIFTIFAITGDAENPFRGMAPVVIGLTLAACILGSGPLSGAALNPARWFGPALVSGTFADWWIYLIGPIAGGVAASLLWSFLFAPKSLEK